MYRPSRCGGAISATSGPSTMNWPHSAIAIRIATPAKTVVAASVECVSVAGVDEDDDTDPNGPDRCMRLRKRREDEGEERAADHHKREVARDQGEQEPIPSNSSETPCALARRRSIQIG